MHRFFIPSEWINESSVTIRDKLAYQLRHVLRLRANDQIVVLDNSGWEYEVEIASITREQIEAVIKNKYLSQNEPRTNITLYQAILKRATFEFVLQKCTELGIAKFVPIICERCVAKWDSNKLARWQSIIIEAAEQSHRSKLPILQPALSFHDACDSVIGHSLLAWEEERETSLRDAFRCEDVVAKSDHPMVNLFIGPEGGFSSSEVELARNHGIAPFTLGKRVLRAETAGPAATAIILYESGDLGR